MTAGVGGTDVEANPAGTDGDDLTRIAIGGTNYNVGAATGLFTRTTILDTATISTSAWTEVTLTEALAPPVPSLKS